MTKRRLQLGIALLVVLLSGGTIPATLFRNDITGWWRGEAKYQGRYTNYWREELRREELQREEPRTRPKWLAKLPPGILPNPPRFKYDDPETVPVLTELLRDPDQSVRELAARHLGLTRAKDAIPALLRALDDDDVRVSREAALALLAIDPRYAHTDIQLLAHGDPCHGYREQGQSREQYLAIVQARREAEQRVAAIEAIRSRLKELTGLNWGVRGDADVSSFTSYLRDIYRLQPNSEDGRLANFLLRGVLP